MKLSREVTVWLNRILNDYLPPIIRDQRWFGKLLTWTLFKESSSIYMTFHERVYEMSDEDIALAYSNIHSGRVEWDTCLTKTCIETILKNIIGSDVLEVGCGKGYLSNLISKKHNITACDVVVSDSVRNTYPAITFIDSPAEQL